jgi:hypothetical protein
MASSLLTHSRMSCSKTCLRKHYYQYELGVRKDRDSQPLRMGRWVHECADMFAKKVPVEEICNRIRTAYSETPAWVTTPELLDEWMVECETVIQLGFGHAWRWSEDGYDVIASELEFRLPCVNPDTGAKSLIWVLGGKCDRIVRLPDGRLALWELKTTSDPIDPDSDYWRRLRIDQQISMYYLACRELGYDISTVIYDVIKKPTIKPLQIPLLDENGIKIVLDSNGDRVYLQNGKPRQAGDEKQGWVLQHRLQTAGEYSDRLYNHIRANPDNYFARHEIPRLEQDLKEFSYEVWQIQKLLRNCQKTGHWYRNTTACISPWRCEYLEICTQGIDLSEDVPQGFVKLNNVHPELGETINGADAETAAADIADGDDDSEDNELLCDNGQGCIESANLPVRERRDRQDDACRTRKTDWTDTTCT